MSNDSRATNEDGQWSIPSEGGLTRHELLANHIQGEGIWVGSESYCCGMDSPGSLLSDDEARSLANWLLERVE